MLKEWWVLLLGLAGGAVVGIQSPIAATMGQRIGGVSSSLIINLTGAIFSAIVLFFIGGENIKEWRTLPWYMLIAGSLGVLLIFSISITMPRLGTTMMASLIIIGQLGFGVIIDHFGWFGVTPHPLNLSRFIGVIALLAGGYLVARG
jgi:bacterial/archaeal transporter family-2 protein